MKRKILEDYQERSKKRRSVEFAEGEAVPETRTQKGMLVRFQPETPLEANDCLGIVDGRVTLCSERLLRACAEEVDQQGLNALYHACALGDLTIFKNTQRVLGHYKTGETLPQLLAARFGNLELLRYLEDAHPYAVSDQGNTPMHEACAAGQEEIVRYLCSQTFPKINFRNRRHESPMYLACLNNHYRIAEILLGFPQVDLYWAEQRCNLFTFTSQFHGHINVLNSRSLGRIVATINDHEIYRALVQNRTLTINRGYEFALLALEKDFDSFKAACLLEYCDAIEIRQTFSFRWFHLLLRCKAYEELHFYCHSFFVPQNWCPYETAIERNDQRLMDILIKSMATNLVLPYDLVHQACEFGTLEMVSFLLEGELVYPWFRNSRNEDILQVCRRAQKVTTLAYLQELVFRSLNKN